MSEYEQHIAKIESTKLGFFNGAVLTTWLNVKYGDGMGQGIGGYGLDEPLKYENGETTRRGTAYGCEFIRRVMVACGVQNWEDIPGRTIFVLTKPGGHGLGLGSEGVVGIAPLPTEPGEPLIFADLAAEFGIEATV